ncbi:hypothetical protein TSAR_001563 [Trichomalopsis sarcophagae]|uniref:Saposin B-type domain-containing protein n=1 Tax=Trichomalopsis sarcophagae TaxID=543379 RepID=A0A232EUW9_9HYME|nr:hypothetical protein TSAR_001563 [Trichomalopsis sarcophagae]
MLYFKMSHTRVFIFFACLSLVFISLVKADEQNSGPSSEEENLTVCKVIIRLFYDVQDEQLNTFKDAVDKEIVEKHITCENHEEFCKREEGDIKNKKKSTCRIILANYLCKGPQNLSTMKVIVDKLMKLADDE